MCSKLRPHHILCISFFEGRGYSSGFVRHMEEVIQELEQNPTITLAVEEDTICSCCPNLEEDGCKTKERVRSYDRRVLEICGWEEGISMSFEQFQYGVRKDIIESGKLKLVCGDCGWADICHWVRHKKDTVSSANYHI